MQKYIFYILLHCRYRVTTVWWTVMRQNNAKIYPLHFAPLQISGHYSVMNGNASKQCKNISSTFCCIFRSNGDIIIFRDTECSEKSVPCVKRSPIDRSDAFLKRSNNLYCNYTVCIYNLHSSTTSYPGHFDSTVGRRKWHRSVTWHPEFQSVLIW